MTRCRDCIYNYWSMIREIDAAGHQLASHTFSHADLATLTQAQVAQQMNMLDATLVDIIGKASTSCAFFGICFLSDSCCVLLFSF